MAFFATHSGSPREKTRCAATAFSPVNFPKIVNWPPAQPPDRRSGARPRAFRGVLFYLIYGKKLGLSAQLCKRVFAAKPGPTCPTSPA